MRKWILVVTLITLLISSIPVLAEDTYDDGFRAGQEAGESVNTFSAALISGVGAFAGGLLFGEIGATIGFGLGSIGPFQVPAELQKSLEGKSSEYRKGFLKGYQKKVKSKKLWPGILGGSIGYLTLLVLTETR